MRLQIHMYRSKAACLVEEMEMLITLIGLLPIVYMYCTNITYSIKIHIQIKNKLKNNKWEIRFFFFFKNYMVTNLFRYFWKIMRGPKWSFLQQPKSQVAILNPGKSNSLIHKYFKFMMPSPTHSYCKASFLFST